MSGMAHLKLLRGQRVARIHALSRLFAHEQVTMPKEVRGDIFASKSRYLIPVPVSEVVVLVE